MEIKRYGNLVLVKATDCIDKEKLERWGFKYNPCLNAWCKEFNSIEEAQEEERKIKEMLKPITVEDVLKQGLGEWLYCEHKIKCQDFELVRIFFYCPTEAIFRFMPKDGTDLDVYIAEKLNIPTPVAKFLIQKVFGDTFDGGTLDFKIPAKELTKEKIKEITNKVKDGLAEIIVKAQCLNV